MKEMLKDLIPSVNASCFVHKTAVIIGNVKLAENVSVWPNAVLRGDIAGIEIGENSNVQDNTSIHVNHDRPVIIGKGTTLGHNVVVHGSVIGNNCLIGMNAVVLESELGDNCIVGAGSVVTAGKKIPSGSLVMGIPGKIIRQLTEDEINATLNNAKEYVRLAAIYKEDLEEI